MYDSFDGLHIFSFRPPEHGRVMVLTFRKRTRQKEGFDEPFVWHRFRVVRRLAIDGND